MPGEFAEREVARLTIAVDKLTETITRLEQRMAETYVRKDVYERDREADEKAGQVLDDKVNGLISLRDWAVKLIVGAVLLALLGLVLVTNGSTP